MTTQFGNELRKEREAQGFAVEDICAATKVSAHNVRLLEAGELRGLPGGVFRRGIVRSYVGALALDESLWMDRFEVSCREIGLSSSGERDWVQFAENVKRGRSGEPRGLAWHWFGVAFLVLSLWAMAWLAWHFVVHPRLELRTNASVLTRNEARQNPQVRNSLLVSRLLPTWCAHSPFGVISSLVKERILPRADLAE